MGYNPSDIIVINDEKFAFIGSELVANIDTEKVYTISSPFSTSDFFVSPELLKIKEIPSKIHYKTAYFSLGLLLIYMLLGDDDFYNDYLKHNNSEKIMESLNNHPVKNTRIYWLLSRCLVEEAKNRSIILL
jgi:serine/threonine protein kinase